MAALREHKRREVVQVLAQLRIRLHRPTVHKTVHSVRQQRGRNHRFHIVQNAIRRSGAHISIRAEVPGSRQHYAFVKKDANDLFFLPSLDYSGPIEIHNILKRVVRDAMTVRDIKKMLEEMEGRLASKSDLEALNGVMTAAFEAVDRRLNAVDGRLVAIDGNLSRVNDRLDKADTHFLKLADTLDGLDHYVRENLPPKP